MNYSQESKFYYFLKEFHFFNNIKNKETIKSLNPSYYKICEFIEFMFSNVKKYIYNNLKQIESTIFIFYIIIFVLKKVPYKLKNFLCILYKDQKIEEEENNIESNFDSLIKEDYLENKSYITELEILIILTLFEIKGECILSIKEYFQELYKKIENQCNKYKELNFPEINFRSKDDEIFIERFKYHLKNNSNDFIDKLKYNFPFYNLIFILEKNNNLLGNEIESDDYLEKAIYKSINHNDNNLNNIDNINYSIIYSIDLVKKAILSLSNFNSNSLYLLNKSFERNSKELSNFNSRYFKKRK
jgi:hypothetical protein